ncbi:hypothetical protein ACER0C_003245 [Sarotherodon galilaeus]
MKMMIMLLLLFSQHASGVEVYEGVESVLLPCQVPADVSRNSTAAVWDRVGLSNPTVHLRREKSASLDERDDLSGQNDFYKHRTSMRVDALQTGDLSLTLRNPTVSDSGTYTCITRKAGNDLKKIHVQLKVKEPPVWPKVLAAVLVTLSILAAPLGLFVYCAYKRMKDREALQPEVVDVPHGKESVLLPCKTTAVLPQDVTVEWTRSDYSNMTVHVYESGKDHPDKQHQDYRGRTEMKNEHPLRNKDLSLTLKDLYLTDSGPYTCTVYKKDGHVLLQKVVTLRFDDLNPEILKVEQEKSVLLPFKTTADLPQDVTVEWRLTDYNNMKVHVYESGKDHPDKQHQDYRGRTQMDEDPLRTKDLSLTLKHPRFTDRGVYTCTVYNKDGHMLLQKVVFLCVRVPQSEEVEEKEGEEFVLPFKITDDLPQDVTVEWRDSKNMKVHVYESGNNQPDKQAQDYRGRTKMNEDPLKTGDLSLTLKDLRLTDSGSYTCAICKMDGDVLLQKVVTLSVRALQPKVVEKLKVVEVKRGVKSVLLPFKTKAVLPQDVTVEWRLTEPKLMTVHVYECGKDQPDKQHQRYRGRTEMDEDPLNIKDLSLTLKDLHLTDSGVYTCTVYNKDGHMLLQKSVTLSVRAMLPEMLKVPPGQKSVLLYCKTRPDLPQGVTVEWTYSNNFKVHVYKSGKDQPDKQHRDYRGRTEMKTEDPLGTGDLSVRLKDLRLTDSGVYTCTVYNKDGDMLLQESVIITVTATLKDTMAEMLPHHLCFRQRRVQRAQPDQDHRNRNQEQEPLTAEETV